MTRSYAFPPRKILVALDLTPASEAAWKSANKLAALFNASVRGLFVREMLTCPEPPPSAQTTAALEQLRRKLGAGEGQISTAVGKPSSVLPLWAERLGYDLIVTGTHGRTGLDRLLAGSVAEDVARRSPVPVLVARRELGPVARVLAPLNFQPYARRGLQRAGAVAQALGAPLSLLHVVDGPLYGDSGTLKAARHLLDGLADEAAGARGGRKPRTKLAFGDPAEEVGREARPGDLVVLVSRPRGLLDDAVHGPTAARVLRRCEQNVLTFPAERVPALASRD